VILHHYIPL